MSRVRNRDLGHHPIEDCGALQCSVTQPWATLSWTASFTTLIACSSPEKACERRTPAIKLLTHTQTPEPITHVGRSGRSGSREMPAHHQTNKRSPSSETAAHHHRNAHRGA